MKRLLNNPRRRDDLILPTTSSMHPRNPFPVQVPIPWALIPILSLVQMENSLPLRGLAKRNLTSVFIVDDQDINPLHALLGASNPLTKEEPPLNLLQEKPHHRFECPSTCGVDMGTSSINPIIPRTDIQVADHFRT